MAKIPVKSIAKALGKDVNPPVLPASETFNIPEGEITAWHGSPHDFPPVTEIISHKTGERVLVDKNQYPDWTQHPDIEPSDYDFAGDYALGKFDMSKLGTGEGAQAYGHGLYFSERRATAEKYKYDTSKGGSFYKSLEEGNIAKAETILEGDKGKLYEVKIKAREDEFLDFDGLLDDQEFIMGRLDSNRDEFEWALDNAYNAHIGYNPTGHELLRVLSDGVSPDEVAASLNKIGIKGIKYNHSPSNI